MESARSGISAVYTKLFEDRIRLSSAANIAKVDFIDANVGKGLFATKDISSGDIIMRERPVSCIQWSRSRQLSLCCSRCLKFTGPVSLQASFLLQVDSRLDVPMSTGFDCELAEFCPHCQTYAYCSAKCKQLSWNEGHRILCPRPGSRALAFYQHAQTAGIDRFLLAGQIVASLVIKIESGASFVEAWRPYSQLASCSWVDVLQNRAESPEALHLAKAAMSVSLNLLIRSIQEAFPKLDLKGPEISRVLRVDFYASILGAFELNNPRVEKLSPLYKYFLFIAERAQDVMRQHKGLQELLQVINDRFGGVPPSAEGEGVFPLHSTMNHSCSPSATQVLSPDGDARAEVVVKAVRPVRAGEEITVSYIDLQDPTLDCVAARREKLQQDYLFHCNCERCEKEGST